MGSETATCDVCGKEVRKQGLGVHKARAHRNGTPRVVETPTPQKVQRTAAKSTENGCATCLFRGLDLAIDQDLVRRAIVAGMALEAACTFVREAKSALAG